MTKASICTIGDEILIGQIVDTNSSHISRALNDMGIRVTRMLSVGDDRHEILDNLRRELALCDIVIVTGGLGPTKDDITKYALAELSGSTAYREDSGQLEIIRGLLRSRGLDMLDINRRQASVPEKCDVIPNRLGTAPVMVFRFGSAEFGHKCALYSLPGVPFEAIGALDDVLADIRAHFGTGEILHRTVMTYGIAESALAKKLEDWENSLPESMHLAYLPDPLKGVRLRLSIYGGKHSDDIAMMEEQTVRLKEILGDSVYSLQDDTLQNTVGRLLRKVGKTLSAAESCTGGMISSLITSVPGSSEYYLGSVTSYAVSIKEKVLGVPDEVISRHGVVSSECAAAMAEGVRRLTGSDYSVSTTGLAGPGGDQDMNPVGLVWIGVSSPGGTKTCSKIFKNDRIHNIERFAASALDFLRKTIESDLNL